ncbi:serine/threonine-protein kinase [Actinokineospora diospyrosa]|uniref:non-specific serine/threonine protein kinase n=1 Tax=Actinokineospora diospyrosa TaxID=103728 RepID=A0ABT1I8W6_9PSEU|nr:serine/threonine-protein kinase [Actinokineospora diospyrosa]MCP2269032.1 serine/threonine-protein kinase PknG [Actinokineospora diospyrosa]
MTVRTPCVRPGCGGSYLEDGSCDECGFIAPTGAQVKEPPPKPDVPPPPPRGGGETGRGFTGRGMTTGNRKPTRPGGTISEQVTLPPFTMADPANAILSDPKVPYSRRICPACEQLVGQPRGDHPGLDEGFCPRDRTPFSYVPNLAKGSRVERYEVLGCLAYGGLGWIYLARDLHLADGTAERWVVLKGLINSHDPAAVEAAASEKQYLVTVDHPNVVKINDFVEHTDPRTGVVAGYIVMEYLPGRTLYEMLQRSRDERGERAPLPVPVVLRYADDILAAFGYLHRRGLVYCDLKPHNAMQVDQRVKLIDLGAVMRDDSDRDPYGTEGFMAPEVQSGAHRPTKHSDLYTLGRTMAVLSFPFAAFSTTHVHDLPAGLPFNGPYESFGHLLRRAAHPDPAFRFATAEDMREQVLGVLAEVLAHEQDEPRGTVSTLFTRERRVFGTGTGVVAAEDVPPVSWAEVPGALPSPLVDPADSAAGFLATLGSVAPDRLIETLLSAGERTPELLLRLADAHIVAGDVASARTVLDEFTTARPGDWRTEWYLGVAAFADEDDAAAVTHFEAVYAALPGELAPKLALAAALEWHKDIERALDLYGRVWNTDRSYVSAAFGLARTLSTSGELNSAVEVLDDVPESSTHHTAARIAAIRTQVGDPAELPKAISRLDALTLDAERLARLDIEVHGAALLALAGSAPLPTDENVDEETRLRARLERSYRALAKLTTDRDVRSRLVDRANEVRPKTMV